jgi:hypothetical protein
MRFDAEQRELFACETGRELIVQNVQDLLEARSRRAGGDDLGRLALVAAAGEGLKAARTRIEREKRDPD